MENAGAMIYNFPKIPALQAVEPADDNTLTALFLASSSIVFVWGRRKTIASTVHISRPGDFIDFNAFSVDGPDNAMPITVNRDRIDMVGAEREAASLLREAQMAKKEIEDAISEIVVKKETLN